MNPRDSYCSHCGTAFAAPLAYPRTCGTCGVIIWANPVPVAVALVPIGDGLLVVRRGVPPGIGKLALPGGFLEEHESWQVGCAREVREETGLVIEPHAITLQSVSSSSPKPNRLLLFAITAPIDEPAPFVPNAETQERGVIFGPGGLDEVFVFSLHAEAARAYFAAKGVTRDHGFTPR